jgi:Zn-dependent peptidase ImmA (M78 family)
MMLTKYEELIEEAYKKNITVFETDLGGDCGYCYNDVIFINKSSSSTVKYCILLEELGHHFKTVGDITDLTKINNIKQELIARGWAFKKSISPNSIINALLNGANSLNELCEAFNVSEKFLLDAISFYKSKYGLYYVDKNYILQFEPLNILDF